MRFTRRRQLLEYCYLRSLEFVFFRRGWRGNRRCSLIEEFIGTFAFYLADCFHLDITKFTSISISCKLTKTNYADNCWLVFRPRLPFPIFCCYKVHILVDVDLYLCIENILNNWLHLKLRTVTLA